MPHSIEMITIHELLRDPQYREYLKKVPKLPPHYKPELKPWKLIVLKKGETAWRSKRMGTYVEAFNGLKKMLPIIEDGTICSPALPFMPPVKTYKIKGKFDNRGRPMLKSVIWQPRIDADMMPHNWCPYCRRPTVFRMAVRSTKISGGFVTPPSEYALRCGICGASESIVNMRHPERHQQWDPNRPKVV